MKMIQNTILITGGGSGIDRGLAEAFHCLGNQVVIAGRSKKSLDETTSANVAMKSLRVDMVDSDSIRSFAAQVSAALAMDSGENSSMVGALQTTDYY